MTASTSQHVIQSIINAKIHEETDGSHLQSSNVGPIITVSRSFGANGTVVAERLSKRLGLRFYDRALMRAAAEEAQANPYLMELLDERVTGIIDDVVHNLFARHSTKDEMYRALIKVIIGISQSGGGVIVGRGAHLLLTHKKPFRVRIDGSLEECAERVSDRLSIRRKRAMELIVSTNKDRARFVRRVYKRYATSNTYYDLVVNSDLYSADQIVDLIITTMKTAGLNLPAEAA